MAPVDYYDAYLHGHRCGENDQDNPCPEGAYFCAAPAGADEGGWHALQMLGYDDGLASDPKMDKAAVLSYLNRVCPHVEVSA